MKLRRLATLPFLYLSVQVLVAQSPFIGTWKSEITPAIHKSSFTLKIAEREGKIVGSIVLVNPDHSELELPILSPTIGRKTFKFETLDAGNHMDWWLVINIRKGWGTLHGSDRRPGKFGKENGEMLIECRVKRW